jgi:acyl carrier protein
MNIVKDNYELHILSKAINNCIDQTLPTEANKALHLILHQNDDLVWEISTSIFSISGHKVDFSLVRDLANSRIESLKILAAQQEASEAKERILKAKTIAELNAKRIAEKEYRLAEIELQNRVKKAEEAKRQVEEKALLQAEKNYFLESVGDEEIFAVFLKIKKIIADYLEIEEQLVKLDNDVMRDLGADELDATELAMAIEEEFDIKKIPWDISLCNIRNLLNFVCSKLKMNTYEMYL